MGLHWVFTIWEFTSYLCWFDEPRRRKAPCAGQNLSGSCFVLGLSNEMLFGTSFGGSCSLLRQTRFFEWCQGAYPGDSIFYWVEGWETERGGKRDKQRSTNRILVQPKKWKMELSWTCWSKSQLEPSSKSLIGLLWQAFESFEHPSFPEWLLSGAKIPMPILKQVLSTLWSMGAAVLRVLSARKDCPQS